MRKVIVAPSILSGSAIDLRSSLARIKSSGARWVHLDIMDGHFVPNLTFGPQSVYELSAIKEHLFFDVHLMLEKPHEFIKKFISAGADLISIHVESQCNLREAIQEIHFFEKKIGLVVNPETSILRMLPFLNSIDLVVVMGVHPGFGGQKMIPEILEKIAAIRRAAPSVDIEIDGGVAASNARSCIEHGANIIVTGSAFFDATNPKNFVQQIENE